MKGETETLLKFKNFDAWGWSAEFQQALIKHKPAADETAIARMRFEIVTQYVEFIREIVSEEFRLGLLVDVEGLTAEGVVGRVDFKDDRRTALAEVEEAVGAWGRIPKLCRTGPILDRLLFCTEVVRAPDRLKLGEFKRECLTRFRHDGAISLAVEDAHADGSYDDPFRAAPVRTVLP
ncbi:hypothetical protein SAMN05216338_1014129 [Bradyrhizobium sp. Rc2d]|uniref:hypothetical protein n=1 Tax=Bradyrhizobium sp. Rc2d TaxID=1855321 RepID=UPI00087E0F78|nr:hypothetical protein [Bradyrhizobium sp. Rc2d]SDH88671.1 hypothetical protein SAMN05216338_1014129 [Bradyrhizobium sp. Rc2d]